MEKITPAAQGAQETISAVRICAVIPTFNNAGTIASVATACREHLADVIVVDDGSTDATAARLRELDSVTVVRHEVNRGKGCALRTGFDRAAEMGFTHAVTLDGDGQHDPADLPAMIAAATAAPDAVVIGVRQLPQGRRAVKSGVLRFNSNFWVWVETGRWIRDTQSGFRVYPLQPLQRLKLVTRKYDFEIESLVKLLWHGGRTVETPVSASYGPGSKSHFRPMRDFALVSLLNTKLVAQRLLPPRVRRRWSNRP